MPDAPCPCGQTTAKGLPLTFTDCCGRWLAQPAPDAERLMRSRYSAFVREDGRWFYVDGDLL